MDCWYVALNEFNDNGEEDDDGGDETKKNLTTTKKLALSCVYVLCAVYMCGLDWIVNGEKNRSFCVDIFTLLFSVEIFCCCCCYCCYSRGLGSSKHTHTHTQQFFAVSLVQIDW